MHRTFAHDIVKAGVFAVALAAASSTSEAQGPERRTPVIVVFHDGASVEPYRTFYRPDTRATADPPAWAYLDRGVAGAVQALEARERFQADHVYSHAVRGFAARLTSAQIVALENDPLVASVEADGAMHAIAQTLPWGINRVDADVSSTKAGDGSGAITNVHAYVIDTGLYKKHNDLRVVAHVNFAGDRKNYDCNGHGTHVAGTIAARDNSIDVVGMASGAPLVGVKVLRCDGSGTTSGVIKGVDWVTANAKKPAVANMSLGGGASAVLDDAVRRSAASGVFYALAAGNSAADACNSSPARAGGGTNNGILTVAATDVNDNEASWSNYGACVDIWAPGVNILSTKKGGGSTTLSGTSMAAPHGAGGGALYLSQTSASPAEVEAAITSIAFTTKSLSKDGRIITRLYVGGF